MTFLKSIQAFADLPAKINRLDKKITEMAAKPAEANAIPPSSRAQRPIGLVFDELSRGINPFSLLETAGVADTTDSIESIAEKFNRFGIVKVKRVYSPEASRELNQQCINFSGAQATRFQRRILEEKEMGNRRGPGLQGRGVLALCRKPRHSRRYRHTAR